MAKKKYKPMTKREKEQMKQYRKELREKGIIPPVKKRLNRKDYIENTSKMIREAKAVDSMFYLTSALSLVMVRTDHKGNVHPEAIGAAKAVRVAIKMKEFMENLEAEGRKQYTYGEIYEYLKETLEE